MTEQKKVSEAENPAVVAFERVGDQMEAFIKAQIPKNLQDAIDEGIANRESKYIDHPDEVCVLDISTKKMAEIDSIPGHWFVETEPAEFTNTMHRKIHRYRVVTNLVPVTTDVYEYTVKPLSEWIEYMRNKLSSGLTSDQMISSLMLRQAGEI